MGKKIRREIKKININFLGGINSVCIVLLLLFVVLSCKEKGFYDKLFKKDAITLKKCITNIETNGLVEDMYCNDTVLIIYNSGLDHSYTLYDLRTGHILNKFGLIGNGHNEIPIGSFGGIYNDKLVVFNDIKKIIAEFSLSKEDVTADTIISYSLDKTMLSSIVQLDSDRYLGLGAYNWNRHFVLFDSKGRVYDSIIPLYNAEDKQFDEMTRFLSNQGLIIKHPEGKHCVGTTNRSGIINFMCIKGNRICPIKSYDELIPSWTPVHYNKMATVEWTDKTINGFLSLSGNKRHVFALYSEDTMNKVSYKSKNILVFDWDGNPIHRIELDEYVSLITVNNTTLYTLSEDNEGNQHINSYRLDGGLK